MDNKHKKVTLEDFIMPQFRGKDPEDYEFRHDGEIVRKDRWQTAILDIQEALMRNGFMETRPEFNIPDVVEIVLHLIETHPDKPTQINHIEDE